MLRGEGAVMEVITVGHAACFVLGWAVGCMTMAVFICFFMKDPEEARKRHGWQDLPEAAAALRADLAAAQAERDALKEMLPNTTGPERPPYTSWWEWAITYRRQLKKAEAEAAALRADAERYRWLRMNRLWLKANLPMIAAPELDTAIDQARGDGNG